MMRIPKGHFLDSEGREHPLIVNHATGEPVFVVIEDKFVPYEQYRNTKLYRKVAEKRMTIQSSNSSFSGSIKVN